MIIDTYLLLGLLAIFSYNTIRITCIDFKLKHIVERCIKCNGDDDNGRKS